MRMGAAAPDGSMFLSRRGGVLLLSKGMCLVGVGGGLFGGWGH